LLEAGIERARGLLAASDSDAGNTYITLTAKAMRPEMLVVARAGQPQKQEKMRRAGADRVISPYLIGGRRMALSALQPLVVDFVDTLIGGGRLGEKIIAELEATEESGLIGRNVGELVPATSEAVVLAVQQATGELVVSPRGSVTVSKGDVLIVVGREPAIEAFTRFRGEKAAPDERARAVPSRTADAKPL
jgi:voltage-gated potassium channel